MYEVASTYPHLRIVVSCFCRSLSQPTEFILLIYSKNYSFSFLVGGDSRIYEGAGWHKVGAHTRGFNTRSLGISFIGDFSSKYFLQTSTLDINLDKFI